MRGNGRIYQRGKVQWVAYYLRGVEFRESTGSEDAKAAEKFLKARLKEVGADQIGARQFTTPKACRLTVADLVKALKADFELRAKASSQNLCYLKKVEADFGQTLAVGLTAEKLDTYIEGRLAAGAAPASINRVTQLLGQSYSLAIRRGHLSRAPYIRHLSEAGNSRQGFFSETELAAVIENLPEDLRDFTRFAALTGMRKNELASLTWKMLEGGELHVPGDICKNRQARVLPLAGELAQIIERRRQAARIEVNGVTQLAEPIFHRGGRKIGCFKKAWRTACAKAQVPSRLFHDLRRSAVRRMVRAGINPQIAKKWSGHVSDSMFQRYSILTTDDMREAFEQTEKFRETEAARVVSIAAQK